MIYLVISVPFIARDIAQMTSNGETFRVAVIEGDQKYRRFVKGTNAATYEPLEVNGKPAQTDSKETFFDDGERDCHSTFKLTTTTPDRRADD